MREVGVLNACGRWVCSMRAYCGGGGTDNTVVNNSAFT